MELRSTTKNVFKTENNKAKVFKRVKVYAVDPWHETETGKIRKLTLTNMMVIYHS